MGLSYRTLLPLARRSIKLLQSRGGRNYIEFINIFDGNSQLVYLVIRLAKATIRHHNVFLVARGRLHASAGPVMAISQNIWKYLNLS